MLAVVERRDPVLWLNRHLDQPHVVFLAQTVQRQHCCQDCRRFDTDEHGPVNMSGEHRPIGRDDQQVHGMLIDLADVCWIGNGEDKGLGRHARTRSMFEARAGLFDWDLLGNALHEPIDLLIGRDRDGLVLTLAELLGKLFEVDIFVDGHDRWSERLHVQLADQGSKLWMQSPITMIGRIGDTSNLSKLLGPAHQARKRGGRHPIGRRSPSDPHPGQHGCDRR